MQKTSLSRRLLAGGAGLAVGIGGALAATAPAHAYEQPPPVEDLHYAFFDTCAGTNVLLMGAQTFDWTVTVDDETVYPTEDNGQPTGSFFDVVFVPADAGEIQLDFNDSPNDWPKVHIWEEPDWCAEAPDLAHTAPTCEDAGTITIPTLPELETPPPPEMLPDPGSGPSTANDANSPLAPIFRLNGQQVDPDTTHTAEPGTHAVTFGIHATVDELDLSLELVLYRWVVEFDKPECDDEGQGGGELPETGAPTGLIAGGAVLLLVVGGGLYLLARRRRYSFTA